MIDRDATSPLYEQLRDRLFAEVLDGTRADGSFLPTEAELAQSLGLSRVTVRRALQALKDDGVIASVQGQGTRVTYRNSGHAGALNLIALVADMQSDFFLEFMHHLEDIAERRGALVMLKTDRSGRTFTSDGLFQKLTRAGIRDLVLWPPTSDLDPALYGRLRAVGVNLVVFDQQVDVPWADVVCLDNRGAIVDLLAALRKKGSRRPALISYRNLKTPTVVARQRAFEQLTRDRRGGASAGGRVFEIDDGPAAAMDRQVRDIVEREPRGAQRPDGWIGVNGGIGLALARVLRGAGASGGRVPIGTIDRMRGMDGQQLIAIDQPMRKMAAQAFACLQRQHRQAGQWKARLYPVPGTRVVT